MSTWILLLILTNFKHQVTSTSVEFATREGCEKAAQTWTDKSSHFHKYEATCFENPKSSATTSKLPTNS